MNCYIAYAVGREQEICRQLGEKNITAFAPSETVLERKKGTWTERKRTLFPGYIFIFAERITPMLYYLIRKTDGVVRFLGSPPEALKQVEVDNLQWLFDDPNIEVSKGYISNGKLVITDGQLKGRERYIIKYSRRQQRATLEIKINGKPHRFTASVKM